MRGVGTPVDAVVVVAALAVPSFSLVAFWLYSLGMHRAAVPSTTAALIVLQTFVPAAVGVAFLGDGVRDGWWPVVLVGLVLATAGAVALSRPKSRVSETGVFAGSRSTTPSSTSSILVEQRPRRASPRPP